MAGHLPGCFNHLPDRKSDPVAQVEDITLPPLPEVPERPDVGLGQIRNMDIIPDAGAVRRIIVCSENGDVVPLPQRNLEDQRNQMGFRIMRFSDLSVWMGSAGIEIPQRLLL